MDLTQLANLGEFIGGVAVLLTLVYLVVETRRNRIATETASVDSLASGFNAINTTMFGDGENMGIFVNGSRDPEGLPAIDRARFYLMIQSYVNHFQTIKRHRDAGTIPEQEWTVYAADFRALMSTPGGVWAMEGLLTITPDLRDMVASQGADTSRLAFFQEGDSEDASS